MRADTCKADGPLLTDKAGNPIWLDTKALIKRSTHCVPPRLPAMARQARIEGQVLLDILVSPEGKVACIQVLKGHPMLIPGAIDSAKEWTFRPMKQKGRAIFFRGHLSFHFSTSGNVKGENPCTIARF